MSETLILEEAWTDMAADASRLAAAAGKLKRISKALSKADGYASLKKVERALAQLDQIADDLPQALRAQVEAAASPVKAWLATEWTRRGAQFGETVKVWFADRSVALTGEGETLDAAPLTLHIKSEKDRVDLSYLGEPVKNGLPMSPARVFDAREAALARFEKAQTDPDHLADAIIAAYDALGGDRVRVPDVHFELFVQRQTASARTTLTKARIKEYSRAQFAWDFGVLLAAPEFLRRHGRQIELIEASPSAAKSRTASIRMVTPDGVRSFAGLRVHPAG